jgi:uncharacterized membrane protein
MFTALTVPYVLSAEGFLPYVPSPRRWTLRWSTWHEEVADMSGSYLHWGVIQISLTNFVLIVAMVVVFALAIVIPMRRHRRDEDGRTSHENS